LELCHTILTIPKVLKLYTINKVEVSPVAIFPPVDIPPLVNYLEQLLSRRDEASLLSGRSETGYSEPNSARRRACCGFAFAETTKLRVFPRIRETQPINTGCWGHPASSNVIQCRTAVLRHVQAPQPHTRL